MTIAYKTNWNALKKPIEILTTTYIGLAKLFVDNDLYAGSISSW